MVLLSRNALLFHILLDSGNEYLIKFPAHCRLKLTMRNLNRAFLICVYICHVEAAIKPTTLSCGPALG